MATRSMYQIRQDALSAKQLETLHILELRQEAETRVLGTQLALEVAQDGASAATLYQQELNAKIAAFLGIAPVVPTVSLPDPVRQPAPVRRPDPVRQPDPVEVAPEKRLLDAVEAAIGNVIRQRANDVSVDALAEAVDAIDAAGFRLSSDVRSALAGFTNPKMGGLFGLAVDETALKTAGRQLMGALGALRK